MFVKEQGWILVIDQASNAAGVSLWYFGKLISTTILSSKKKTDPIGTRLVGQVAQLTTFLSEHLPAGDSVSTVIFEGVRARLVALVVGAFLTCPLLGHCKIHPKWSFIESSSWKWWAWRNGAVPSEGKKVKDLKGVYALSQVGFDCTGIVSDDIADSILMYLTWREK